MVTTSVVSSCCLRGAIVEVMVNDEAKLENPNSVEVVSRRVDGSNFRSAVTYISK